MRPIIYLLTSVFLSYMITSCSEKDDFSIDPFEPQTYDIQGKVEKGPFISGSTLYIQPMDSKLQVLGSVYNTAITDDLGNFMLGSKEFSTPYAEFMANGYFFNEVKGELSNGTLTLRALVDLQDNTTVNVNILTHLKYARIKNLVSSGNKYSDANKQAQAELMKAFGLEKLANKDVSSISMISGTDESAALLAISSLLMMERTEAALTEYLAKLSADFGKNGSFSDEMLAQIIADKNKLASHLSDIKDNVINRYDNLGIDVEVRELSHFVDWNNDGVAGNEILKDNQSVTIENTSLKAPNKGGKFAVKISSPIPLYLEPQVEIKLNTSPNEGIVASGPFIISLYEGYDDSYFLEKEIISECSLKNNTLEINISELEARSAKTKVISIYDYIGNVVATIEISQEGKSVEIPIAEAPLLGENGQNIVSGIAMKLVKGLRGYNVIEQYYAYNKTNNKVKEYVFPGSSQISNSWSYIYSANATLLLLKKMDESLLNVYGDYFNVWSALYYSNLVYGWDAVPYIYDFSIIEQAQIIHRESATNVFTDLKNKLANAIQNLTEKKNEPLKDINGLFFTSKDVARVLLANIHMYQGNYKDAKDLLQKVIDNGFYTLDASKDFKPSTSTDDIDVTQSTEVILAFQYDAGTRPGIIIVEPGVMPYITLSEVYLSLAECHYQLGDYNVAEQCILKILEAKSLSSSETDVLMRIKDIREQILLYNGTYFAFLKRSGLAKNVCNIEDYQLLFPIPSDVMFSDSKITQNPGY